MHLIARTPGRSRVIHAGTDQAGSTVEIAVGHALLFKAPFDLAPVVTGVRVHLFSASCLLSKSFHLGFQYLDSGILFNVIRQSAHLATRPLDSELGVLLHVHVELHQLMLDVEQL